MIADRQQVNSAPGRPSRLKERRSSSRAGLSVIAGGRERNARTPRTHAAAAPLHVASRAPVRRMHEIMRPMGALRIERLDSTAPGASAAMTGPRLTIARRVGALLARHRALLPLPFVMAVALLSETRSLLAAGAGTILVVAGIALRLAASAAAARGRGRLVTWGAYAWLRHPHDLGTILAWAGIAFAAGATTELPALVLGIVMVHLLAARTEERVLAARHGEEFARWQRRTPAWLPRAPVASLARAADPAAALSAERVAVAGFAALLLVATLGTLAR